MAVLKEMLVLDFLFLTVCFTSTIALEEPTCISYLIPREPEDCYLNCQGDFTDLEKLPLLIQNAPLPIKIFELQDAVFNALPSDIFHNVENASLTNIILSNVSLELTYVPELGSPAFKSVEDTAESLEVYGSSSVFSWNFEGLSLRSLRRLIIEDSDLYSISPPFSFWPELRFLQILKSNVQWIHPKAFKENEKLTICSLSNNRIFLVSRSMFPQPATYLYSLDLSFNRIDSLPDDFFFDMEALSEVKLDNNRLKKIAEKVLLPVWNSLNQFWIDGNFVNCDSVCWMRKRKEKPFFLESSRCKESRKLFYISLSFLKNCESNSDESW